MDEGRREITPVPMIDQQVFAQAPKAMGTKVELVQESSKLLWEAIRRDHERSWHTPGSFKIKSTHAALGFGSMSKHCQIYSSESSHVRS